MDNSGKQSIKLKIGGKEYSLSIDPAKEELYRAAEREVNAYVAKFEKARIDGFAKQDCLALTALQLAISNLGMARSREVGDEDVKRLASLSNRISEYLDDLKS